LVNREIVKQRQTNYDDIPVLLNMFLNIAFPSSCELQS